MVRLRGRRTDEELREELKELVDDRLREVLRKELGGLIEGGVLGSKAESDHRDPEFQGSLEGEEEADSQAAEFLTALRQLGVDPGSVLQLLHGVQAQAGGTQAGGVQVGAAGGPKPLQTRSLTELAQLARTLAAAQGVTAAGGGQQLQGQMQQGSQGGMPGQAGQQGQGASPLQGQLAQGQQSPGGGQQAGAGQAVTPYVGLPIGTQMQGQQALGAGQMQGQPGQGQQGQGAGGMQPEGMMSAVPVIQPGQFSAQISQELAANLQKLKAVIKETQGIAQKIEMMLAAEGQAAGGQGAGQQAGTGKQGDGKKGNRGG